MVRQILQDAPMPGNLEAYLHDLIHREGPIPFDRFMDLALYHPQWGYYERPDTEVGRRGDFQTSVSVGSLFGTLLAYQFHQWSKEDGIEWILECGAHHGQLAEDVLHQLDRLGGEKSSGVSYLILEPSMKRKRIQQERLRGFGSRVQWMGSWDEALTRMSGGVVFSNELLDAFPVKRFVWNARSSRWLESAVCSHGQQFDWILQEPVHQPGIAWMSDTDWDALRPHLPDGYVLESSPAAEAWWRSAAIGLRNGYLMAVDYGFTGLDRLAPQRTQGTLRTYSKHRVGDDLLAIPGEQDITAHVDFPTFQRIGEEAGLETLQLAAQEVWMRQLLECATDAGFEPNSKELGQFRTLMHPEHFGKSFKVLLQRGAG